MLKVVCVCGGKVKFVGVFVGEVYVIGVVGNFSDF